MAQAYRDNRLLALLSNHDLQLLQPDLKQVMWQPARVLASRGVAIEHVFFPTRGFVSVVAVTTERRRLEVGIYGREGFGPTTPLFEINRSPYENVVQLDGAAWQISVEKLTSAAARSPSLRAVLMRYAHVFSIQNCFTALANGSHVIDERIARWLLMCHDRIDGDGFAITHDTIGLMLGIRRPGVTTALHKLDIAQIIRATRGHIVILDRNRLEEIAGDSYGEPEAEYRRLIGSMR